MMLPSLVLSLVTLLLPALVTQMLVPSKQMPSGFMPTAYAIPSIVVGTVIIVPCVGGVCICTAFVVVEYPETVFVCDTIGEVEGKDKGVFTLRWFFHKIIPTTTTHIAKMPIKTGNLVSFFCLVPFLELLAGECPAGGILPELGA